MKILIFLILYEEIANKHKIYIFNFNNRINIVWKILSNKYYWILNIYNIYYKNSYVLSSIY